ncbi:MAG: hypothetical protein Q7J04_00575 [Microcella sp.]|nr:hypothetical protein [Microcella sp.]
MYAALWRILPGPTWVRVVILVVAAVVVLAALVEWVFPWASATLLPQESTIDG